MSQRTANRRTGRVAVTQQQLRRGTSGAGASAIPGDMRELQRFPFTTADFVADGSLFTLTCTHGLAEQNYIYQIFEPDDGSELIPDKIWRGNNDFIIWFKSDSKNVTVNIF